MKPLFDFAYLHLETLLRFAGVTQLGLAVLSFFLPRLMKWEPELARLPLLLQEVFAVHAMFISITLAIWGVLTWRFASEMATHPSDLARWVCAAIALFWGVRAVMQWTHYSPTHWRGIPSRTVIHGIVFFGYVGWTTIYAMAAFAH